ncbi:MAG: alpha/beta hydrolase [Myxococcota bacterium]
MPVDPQAQAVLDQFPPMPDDLSGIDAVAMREGMNQGALGDAEPEPVAKVIDRTIPGPAGEIPVRVYLPEGDGPFPGLVYFHGGGFVVGNLDTHDGVCRQLANGAGCAVVSVDYRLAPEHRFPAAPEDCYAATAWVAKEGAALGIDTSRLAVGGDSAGGNLTAATTLLARERGGPKLRFQLLVYPVTDCAFDTASYEENATGYFLTRSLMRWFWDQYLAEPAEAEQAIASPLRAQDVAGLPPGICITAGYDPLRDEGEAYAKRLVDAGVACPVSRYDGMIHGFFSMPFDASRQALQEAAKALREALA